MTKEDREVPPWGSGSGTGKESIGGRRGRMGKAKLGPGFLGECVCPLCGTTTPHQLGISCFHQRCPKCGAPMVNK
jgi:hypothetical protein